MKKLILQYNFLVQKRESIIPFQLPTHQSFPASFIPLIKCRERRKGAISFNISFIVKFSGHFLPPKKYLSVAGGTGFEPVKLITLTRLAGERLRPLSQPPIDGGSSRIRTYGALTLNGFQDRRLKPTRPYFLIYIIKIQL